MTRLLSIDPGLNSGIALGYYDATTPYQLLERWQVHGGVSGFHDWWLTEHGIGGSLQGFNVYDLVVEKFILDPQNQFTADLTPVKIEGAMEVLNADTYARPIAWQPRTDKAALIGYPPSAHTKAQKQRARFYFLKKHGLFKPGTENDDSNDAICHALIALKKAKHTPTLRTYWGPRSAT